MAGRQSTQAFIASRRRKGAHAALLVLVAWLIAVLFAAVGTSPAHAQEVRASAASSGYLLADSAGVITAFGEATSRGGLDGATLQAPIVDGDMTPTGLGYVLVGSDGGVFSFGDAPKVGSMGGTPLNSPIVGIDITPTGKGYILAAADGGVFAFGDAPFKGSMGGIRLNSPVVDIGLTAANDGYRLSATDGGVFAFGNASFNGSMGGRPLNKPVTGLIGQKDGPGYALVAADGGFFAFGGFVFRGSLGSIALSAPIVDAVPSPTGLGYNLIGSDGGVFAFGDAPYRGSSAGTRLPHPIVTILGLTNESPDAKDDSFNATEDTALVVGTPGVLANDTDGDGDTLTASLVTGPAHGGLSLNGNGSFTYTPAPNYNGADSFTYKVADGYGGTDTATATITVAAVNDIPVAGNDAYATDEDAPLVVTAPGVLANDSDVETASPTAVLVTGPTKGTLTLNSNGSFTYVPNLNTSGADSFTYKANDGTADSNVATVGLTVNALNDAPVAVDDAHTTNEDTALNVAAPGVLGNDADVEGSSLTAVLVTGPSKGTLTLNADGSFAYTPTADTNGADSFTYKANDGTADSNVATVSLTVTGANDAPTANDDAAGAGEDGPAITVNVLGNDTDIDGDTLTVSAVDTTGTSGTVTNNGTDVTYDPNGTFALAAGQTATDTFTYTASDGHGGTDTATVTVTVTGANDAPVLAGVESTALAYDTGSGGSAVTSTLTVADVDSPVLAGATVAITSGYLNGKDSLLFTDQNGITGNWSATTGVLTLSGSSSLANYQAALRSVQFAAGPTTPSGARTLSFQVDDGAAADHASNVATRDIAVTHVNHAPVANDDAAGAGEDGPAITINVPGNDTDIDGDSPLTVSAVDTTGTSGTVTNNGTDVTYDPNGAFESLASGESATDTFTYTVSDGHGGTDTATVTVTITGANDAPTAIDDAAGAGEDGPAITINVLGNDTDPDTSDTLTVSAVDTTGTMGTVTITNAGADVSYDPNGQFEGLDAGETAVDTFTYTASDGQGGTDNGLVTVTITGANDAPTASPVTDSTNEDTPKAVALTGTDVDVEALTFSIVTGPTHGSLGAVTGNSVTYTPDADYSGADSFTYKANDGTADSNVATVNVTVHPVADAPIAVDDGPFQTTTNTDLVRSAPGVLANDTDADGQTLTAGNASDPANGTVILNLDGSFSYTPDNNFTGTDTFTYDVTDGVLTDTGTVTINSVPPNATPTADATSASGNEDGGAIAVTLTGHDADDHNLTFTVGTAGNGLVTVPGAVDCTTVLNTCTTTVTYTPGANFNTADGPDAGTDPDTDSFTYTVNDGFVTSAPATATMTVNPVNDEPGFTKGDNQTVNEDAAAQTVNGWATAISAGPPNESSQTVTFTVTDTNNALFSVAPAVSSAGALTYTPAANANGSATVSVTAVDNGGTTSPDDNTGATQTFTITVTAVNDVPSFTAGSDQTPNEDAGAQSVSNWATAVSKGPADESAQTLSFTTSNTNNGLFSVQPGVTPTGTLQYTTAPNIYGTATVTISLSDTGGTANGGVDTSGTQTFTITVSSVNDAPVAAAKAYDVQANMKRSLDGLLTGATDPNDVAGNASWSPTYTVGSITAGANCIGCTISNVDNANGTFDIDPPAGGTGTYTVTYTVVDNGTPMPGATSAAQTITFNVAGPVIWFADAAAGNDTTGTGTLTRPFATLTKVATVDAADHRVFVHSGTYAAGIALTDSEWLVGAGTKATSFDSFMGITPPAGTVARPAINGTNPIVQSSVTLGSGNTVRGLTLTGANALTGTSFGTLTTGIGSSADLVLNSTGQALSLTTGTVTGDFFSTTSSGGADNVFLSSVNTTTSTSLGTGALSGATSEGFQVSGGTGSFTYAGTVANAAGTTVSIANKTGGTVTFNGAVSDTGGPGVSLTNNTGATVAFVGGVNLVSASSPAFAATGGGTVSVTGATNTLSSTTGTALNVDNTTIGASDLTFQSISANGATNGILLNATGSVGNLAVTGLSSTLGSGGTIQNTSGDGISLTATRDVSLANVNVTNANGHGIRGSTVTNLTLTRAQVAGAGDADNEHGVFLSNQAGTLAVTAGAYSDATETLLLVENNNTNATVSVTGGTTFFNQSGTFASQAIQLTPNGSSAITATVNGSTFTNIKGSSLLWGAAQLGSTGTSTLTFTNNTVNSASGFAGGIAVGGQENTVTTANITGNSFTGAGGNGVVNYDVNDSSTVLGTVGGNTFTSPVGHAIVAAVDEDADLRLRIDSNTIANAGGDGIQLTNFGDNSTSSMTSTAHFIVTNNMVNGHSLNPATAAAGGISVFHFENDADTTCTRVTGNTVIGSNAALFTYDVFLQDNTASKLLFEENPNTGSTGRATEAYIQSLNNPGTTVANILNIDAQLSNGTTCLAP